MAYTLEAILAHRDVLTPPPPWIANSRVIFLPQDVAMIPVTKQLYDQFAQGMANARSTEDYYHFLFALTSFRQPELAQRTLGLVDQGKIRQQDYVRLFPALLSESPAREIAWDYLKAHWDSLAEKVTSFGGSGAVSALGGFCSPEKHDEIKQFFADHRAPGAERALQQSLQRITSCVEFKQLQAENMQKFLHQTP